MSTVFVRPIVDRIKRARPVPVISSTLNDTEGLKTLPEIALAVAYMLAPSTQNKRPLTFEVAFPPRAKRFRRTFKVLVKAAGGEVTQRRRKVRRPTVRQARLASGGGSGGGERAGVTRDIITKVSDAAEAGPGTPAVM
ncbi:hypothetical protein C8F04DRAFT_1183808 [Mycena alexandri]|uniref:Uncharacterized protein n=1 Tax=Mycena alexandri TaxID=1745969 RepID=A0AAD6X015_9AGAR|nr:hypothetical protein C8F04DRAFT_1183808 [Mycena alexandri]